MSISPALHRLTTAPGRGAALWLGLTAGLPSAADVIVAVALANTLFFSLPIDGARHEVALYLALVLAPVAVLTPAVSGSFARFHPSGSRVLVATAALRSVLALLLVGGIAGVGRYPLALALLLTSRAHAIARTAVAGDLADTGPQLLRLNTKISVVITTGSAGGAVVGTGAVAAGGTPTALVLAAALYAGAALFALRAPARAERSTLTVDQPAGDLHDIRRPVVASGVLRTVAGYLTLLLAVQLKERPVALMVITVVAALGAAVGPFGATLLRRRVPLPTMPLAMATTTGIALTLASVRPQLPTLSAAAATTVFAWSTAKIALDGVLQRRGDFPARRRMLSSCACAFQLCWIGGAAAGLLHVDLVAGLACAASFTLLAVAALQMKCPARTRSGLVGSGGSTGHGRAA